MASESPPPDPPTTTTTTDSASLPEDAEDNNNTMVEVSSSELAALRAEAGEAHTLRSQLGISRTKVGELKAELTTLLEKLEAAESDAHWSKQRYDKMVERMAAEKEAAVTKLKERFREITHKQKQKFMQQQQAIGQERARVTKLQHERQGLVQKLSGADEREAALKERLVQQKAEFTDLREKVKVVQQAYAADKKKWRKEASKESKELEKQQAAVEELQNELEGKTKEIEEFARMERAKRQMQVFMESSSEAPCNGETIKLQVLCNTDYQVQWSRSFCGSRFNDIPGATSEKYLLTADDVGSCLRASCTSVETEHTVTSEIGPILLNPDLVDELKALEEQKEVIFALSPCPRPKKPVQKFILINREKIKIRNEKKKTIDKAEWNPHVNVTLDAVDNTKLLVQINERNISFTYLAESSKERDKIALAIRLFAVRKDIDDSHHLGFVVRYANEIHTQSQAEQQEAGFGVPAGLGASLAAAAAPEFSFSERPGSVRSMQSAGSGADEDDEDAPSNGATPVKKDAPPQKKEVQYDADGYIIRQDSNRGFAATAAPASAFGFDSSSDEEDSLSNRFKKVTIRDADDTAALDSSRLKSATILAPPSSGRGRRATIMAPPSSSKKSKKKSKRKKRNSVSGLPAAAAAAGDVAAGAPTVEVIDEVSPNDGADEEEDDDAAAPGPVRARRMSAPPRAGSTHRIKASPPPTLGTVSENGDDDDDATPPPVDEADPVASMQMHVTPPDQQEEDPDDPFFGVSPIPSPEVPPTPRAVKSSCSALVSVRESVHARFNSGVLSQVAVTGEIAVKLSAKPDVDTVVQLQLNNLGLLNAITPNKANTSSTAPGMYLVRVPAQSDSVVCLKYKVITGSSAASKAKLVPLNLNAQWAIEENVATIDVEYSFKEPFEALMLAKPRFLVEVSPQGAVKELVFSNPECLLNKSKTKFLWKLQQLPVPGDSTNKLHAKLSTVQECLPTPIKASFQIPDRTLSGIEISSVNEPPSVDGQFAVVAKVRRSIVAGTYTAQ